MSEESTTRRLPRCAIPILVMIPLDDVFTLGYVDPSTNEPVDLVCRTPVTMAGDCLHFGAAQPGRNRRLHIAFTNGEFNLVSAEVRVPARRANAREGDTLSAFAEVWVSQTRGEFKRWDEAYRGGARPGRELGDAQDATSILDAFELRRDEGGGDSSGRRRDRRRARNSCTKELAMIGQSFSPRMITVSGARARLAATRARHEKGGARAGHARSVRGLAGRQNPEAGVAICRGHGERASGVARPGGKPERDLLRGGRARARRGSHAPGARSTRRARRCAHAAAS